MLTALTGSGTLSLLGRTTDNLQAARNDPALFETLRIAHELLLVLRDERVLGTFLLLPKGEQANFIRWIGAMHEHDVRHDRTKTFIAALKQSPLANSARHEGPG